MREDAGALCVSLLSGDFPQSFSLCFLKSKWSGWCWPRRARPGMGLPEAGSSSRGPRDFRAQMVASEGQGLPLRAPRTPPGLLWEPVPFCHICVTLACPTLRAGFRERQQAVWGRQRGWEARAPGPSSHGGNTGHSASPFGWKMRRRVKAQRSSWRGRRSSQAAECFPAPGSCCDQEEKDVAGAQCFLPDKPAPPREPRPAYLGAQSPAQGGAG